MKIDFAATTLPHPPPSPSRLLTDRGARERRNVSGGKHLHEESLVIFLSNYYVDCVSPFSCLARALDMLSTGAFTTVPHSPVKQGNQSQDN